MMCGRTPKARRQLDLDFTNSRQSVLAELYLSDFFGHFLSTRESIILSQFTGLDHVHLRTRQEKLGSSVNCIALATVPKYSYLAAAATREHDAKVRTNFVPCTRHLVRILRTDTGSSGSTAIDKTRSNLPTILTGAPKVPKHARITRVGGIFN